MVSNSSARYFLLKNIFEERRRRRRMQTTLYWVIRRRELLLNLSLAALLLTLFNRNATVYNRSCRRLSRNYGWFELVWTSYSNQRFKKTFRLSRTTFMYILNRIRHALERDTVTEDPVSPEYRLALCLYRLGRGDYFYTIAEMAGLGVSTVCTIVDDVTQAIVNNLWSDCVTKHLPKTEDDFHCINGTSRFKLQIHLG